MRLDLLRGLMAQNGVSRQQLGEYLNLCLNSVNNKVNGVTSFTDVEIIQLSELFNVPTDYLLKGD